MTNHELRAVARTRHHEALTVARYLRTRVTPSLPFRGSAIRELERAAVARSVFAGAK